MYTIGMILISFLFGALCGYIFGYPGLLIALPASILLGACGAKLDCNSCY